MDRRPLKLGIILGGLMGLIYGLVAATINVIALPGVPLYSSPPGPILSVLAITLGGMFMGAVVVWPEDSIYGVIAGGVAAAFLTSVAAIIGNVNFASILVLFVYTFLPRALLFAPVAAAMRWAVGAWEDTEGFWTLDIRRKVIAAGVVFGLALAGGLFTLYSGDVRASLKEVDSFMQSNTGAASGSELPASLEKVPGFLENARGAYTLQVGGDPETLAVKRPIVSYGTVETLVVVRFENGYRVGCVHAHTYKEPICWIY